MRKVIWALAGLFLVLLLVWAFMPKPFSVESAAVVAGPFEQSVEEEGKTRVVEKYQISAPLTGTLRRVALKAGDKVEAGSYLTEIDSPDSPLRDPRLSRELKERLEAAKDAKDRTAIALAEAKIAQNHFRGELDKTQTLFKEGFVSRTELDQADLQAQLKTKEKEAAEFSDHVAGHEMEMAKSAFLKAGQGNSPQKSGERFEIRSPVRGVVLRVIKEDEGPVVPGTPILEIADSNDLEVVAEFLTTDAVSVTPGAPARIFGWGGPRPLDARVRRVEPSAFTRISALGVEEQRVNIILDIRSPREDWKKMEDGYRVDAQIILFQSLRVLKIPVSALFKRGEKWFVFIAENGRARLREVDPGRRNRLEAIVEKGLKEGEKVIIYPGNDIRDGVRIREQ